MANKLWTEMNIIVEHIFLVNIYSSRIENVYSCADGIEFDKRFYWPSRWEKQEWVS